MYVSVTLRNAIISRYAQTYVHVRQCNAHGNVRANGQSMLANAEVPATAYSHCRLPACERPSP